MNQSKPALLLIVPLVLLAGLLASCSSDSMVDPVSADKRASGLGSDGDSPGIYSGLTPNYIQNLNKDFELLQWEEVALVFDPSGDSVSVSPDCWPDDMKIILNARTLNSAGLPDSNSAMFTIRVSVPVPDPMGDQWPLITGNCALYKVSDFPEDENVMVTLMLPLPGSSGEEKGSFFWLGQENAFSQPNMTSVRSIAGKYYATYGTSMDRTNRPDNVTQMVLDPCEPGED